MPPLARGGGALVCEFVGKANMLSDHFDSKKSRESVDRYPYSSLITFEFRSREVRRLLIDLDHYRLRPLSDWVCFLFFLRELLM